jgi:hypothetical protein
MNTLTASSVVERLFTEVWGDPHATLPDGLIHDEYWSTDPGVDIPRNVNLEPTITGREAFARELAHYRDFYPDLTLTMVETISGPSIMRGSIESWESRRFEGDVVVVRWKAEATHPTATIVSRGGKPLPKKLFDSGVSVVGVVDGEVFSADKFWNPNSEVLSGMSTG